MPTPQRKRVLSGMRSTGKLHLGNYVGALQNWVAMQDKYECFFFIADWHALTTDYAAGLAGARTDLQGAAGEHHRKGPDYLRISGISGAAGRRYSHLQGRLRASGRRPGAACRADPRNCAAI